MLSTSYNTSGDSSPSHSHFVPHQPPLKKRRLTQERKHIVTRTDPPLDHSPQFVLQNINGEFKLVVVDDNNSNKSTKPAECINLITDNETDISDPQNKHNRNTTTDCINLITSDSCNDHTDNATINKNTNDNDKSIEFHPFLNKGVMNDASDAIYQLFKDIIHKYNNDDNMLSKIEIEGRIGMLLKKDPPKHNKHRNNRYLRVSDDVFGANKGNTNTVKIYNKKQKGCKFDADVKKQTFYYFKTVMNGLYINSQILDKTERLNVNECVSYPSMTYRRVNKIVYKYNHDVRKTEYISECINFVTTRKQKERIANLDICFNFEESDYDIRVSAAIERDENEMKHKVNELDLRCIRCKECVEYGWDDVLKIEISIIHSYTKNLFDGRFIQTLRDDLLKRQKLPITPDCRQREYQIEIEIIDFKKFAEKSNRELKRLSVWFSSTCLQIAKLLGYVNDFAKKTNQLPVLAQFDVNKINKEAAQNLILPLYQNQYYKNQYYHNVLHKQVIDSTNNV